MPDLREQANRPVRRPWWYLAVAVLLLLVGGAAITIGVLAQDPAPPSPPQTQTTPAEPTPTETAPTESAPTATSADELVYSAPVRIRIPRIDVDSALVTLGLDDQGVMETPRDVDKAGWFRPSPPPGVPGATVIAGHVTWDQRPVVFFELGDLAQGDRIEVEREDGVKVIFEVTRTGSFAKDRFPTAEVYDQPAGSELRLITCGGEYDAATNRYLDNVIVWARLVESRQG